MYVIAQSQVHYVNRTCRIQIRYVNLKELTGEDIYLFISDTQRVKIRRCLPHCTVLVRQEDALSVSLLQKRANNSLPSESFWHREEVFHNISSVASPSSPVVAFGLDSSGDFDRVRLAPFSVSSTSRTEFPSLTLLPSLVLVDQCNELTRDIPVTSETCNGANISVISLKCERTWAIKKDPFLNVVQLP